MGTLAIKARGADKMEVSELDKLVQSSELAAELTRSQQIKMRLTRRYTPSREMCYRSRQVCFQSQRLMEDVR